MTERCGWQDKRGNDCARPAAWALQSWNRPRDVMTDELAFSCHVHLADTVKERATEWVGCWVDKA